MITFIDIALHFIWQLCTNTTHSVPRSSAYPSVSILPGEGRAPRVPSRLARPPLPPSFMPASNSLPACPSHGGRVDAVTGVGWMMPGRLRSLVLAEPLHFASLVLGVIYFHLCQEAISQMETCICLIVQRAIHSPRKSAFSEPRALPCSSASFWCHRRETNPSCQSHQAPVTNSCLRLPFRDDD